MNTSLEMCKLAISAMEDKKAEDVKIIDIREISTLADYFIVANGTNKNQVQAMADEVSKKLHEAGFLDRKKEGYDNGNWILMDYMDIVVHIFDKQNRLFYDLERIWRDGKILSPEELNVI